MVAHCRESCHISVDTLGWDQSAEQKDRGRKGHDRVAALVLSFQGVVMVFQFRSSMV